MISYIILVTISYLCGIVIVATQAKRDQRPTAEIFDVIVVMVLSALLGSKLFHAIFEARGHLLSNGTMASGPLDLFLDDPLHGLRIFDPGYVFWGGLLFCSAVTYLFVRIRQIPSPLDYGNYAVPALALGIFLGRIGCFIAGCCYGKAGHPVQLYDAAFGLLVLIYRKLNFVQFLFAYSVWRFITEFFRADADRGIWFWGLSTAQMTCLIIGGSCVVAQIGLQYKKEL